MAASLQCLCGQVVANLRRRAEGHGCDVGVRCQESFQSLMGRHAIQLAVRTGYGDQLECVARGERGNVLVARDLARAYDGEPDLVDMSAGPSGASALLSGCAGRSDACWAARSSAA